MRLLCTALTSLLLVQAQAAAPLKLVTVVAPNNPSSAALKPFIETVFQRSNIAYTLTYLPAKRAGLEFKLGNYDGDAGRTDYFAQFYPAAIRVEPAFLSLPIYAISRDLAIKNWKDLELRPIAYLRGNLLFESRLAQHAQLNPVDQIDGCIKMVKARRVDVCIFDAATHPTTEFTQANPALRLDQFDLVNTYIWLAPQYQAQANILRNTLLKMQKDGSLAALQAGLYNPVQRQAH